LTHARWSSLVLVACAIAQTAGCKKEQDSLVLVNVRANAQASDVTSLTLSAEGTSTVFHVSGLSATPQEFGLYVPSSVVGIVKVSAVAATSAGTCAGYKGQGTATVDKAGATTDPPTTILMTSADICAPDGGAGTNGTGGTSTGGTNGQGGSSTSGTGGTTGQGGTFGTGGATSTGGATGTGGVSGACASTPPPGTPPSLTCCQEYTHGAANCAGDVGVWGAAFSQDGKWLVTGGDDNQYQLWSFDGQTVTLQKQPSWTTPGGLGYGYVAFSPDGKYVALSGNGGIGIYDVGTWAAEKPLTITGLALGVGFTPDGNVVSMDSSTMYLHAVGNATALASVPFTANTNLANGVAVSSVAVSGAVAIAAAGDSASGPLGEIFTYVAPSTLNGPVAVTPYSYYYDYIDIAAIAPNGTSMAFGDANGTIWFSSYPTGPVSPTTELTVDPSGQQVTGLAYSRDGSSLAVVGGPTSSSYVGTVTIWSLIEQIPTAGYQGQSERPISVAFSAAGNAIVVGEYDCGKFLVCTN
jgi:hypothetical protein